MAFNQEIVIVDIPSQGELSGVFSDLIIALIHSMSLLGFKVTYERSLIRTTKPVIVFGLYRLFINKKTRVQMPGNYFIFNLAPIMETKISWFEDYIKCLSMHNLIDYSFKNITKIQGSKPISRQSHFFNFGYFELICAIEFNS